jgi:hypothetical protein
MFVLPESSADSQAATLEQNEVWARLSRHAEHVRPLDGTMKSVPGVSSSTSEFRVRTGLSWLAGFGAFGVGLSALYATTGLGFGCPFRALTGWDCPFCGGTRLGSALLHGDVVAAFWFNPAVFVGLVLLTIVGALWIVEALGGPKARPPNGIAARLRGVTPTRWLIVAGVAAALYTVARNLL